MAPRIPLALLAAALAASGPARAADAAGGAGHSAEAEPPAEPSPSPQPSDAEGEAGEGKGAQPEKAPGENDTWLDVSHAYVSKRIFAPVFRFDRFFSDERELETERERSFLRWRSAVRFTDDSSQPAFTTGVRATLRLPGLNKRLRRLRIVLAGETRDAVSTLFPREGDEDAETEPTTADEDLSRGDAGLRFFLWDSVFSHADLGGGVLVRLPPGAYGRLRFRWAVPVSDLFLVRSAVTGFWRTDVRFGTSVAAEIERPLGRDAAVRLGGSGLVSEESAGLEWGAELALLAAFGQRVAGQFGAAVRGVSRPAPLASGVTPPDLERYRLYARLRRDFYRRWIFLEVEPEVSWPWNDTVGRELALAPAPGGGIAGVATPLDAPLGRHPVWGVTLRVEVQFHGEDAAPPPLPPPPPEPADPPPEGAPPPEEPPR